MPSRILRDGILTSVPINRLSPGAELFYRRLMSVVDDYGRYYAIPGLLRAACYPLQLDRIREDDVISWLIECTKLSHSDTKEPLIVVYAVQGKECLQITKFKQQYKTKPKFPEPPSILTEPLTNRTRPVNESVHLDGDGDVDVDVFEDGDDKGETKVSPPACPHGEIIKLYSVHLPMGRQVRPPWNGERAKHLQARWREIRERQTLGWWDQFFEHCAKSKFLTGRKPPRRPGEKPFEVSLDWIVAPSNFQKIIEGAYDD
jgi:hypothetical protein